MLVVLLGITSCKKDPSLWQIENLNDNKISVFGHGGMGINYRWPMNSLESLQKCLSLGSAGTEMDVSVTRDSVMVLYHHLKLEDATSGDGPVKNKTWQEIKDCRYHLPIVSKANLITASYFFDRIEIKKNLIFTFDCKVTLDDTDEYLNLFANALIKHITKYELVANCFIESYNIRFLKILQAKNSNLHLFLYTQNYKTGLEATRQVNLYGLTLDMNKISAEEIIQAHQNNLHITLFNTQNQKENLDAVKKSPDFIQTDKVDYLVNVLKD